LKTGAKVLLFTDFHKRKTSFFKETEVLGMIPFSPSGGRWGGGDAAYSFYNKREELQDFASGVSGFSL
jgi:hypothetical protein